MNSGSIHEDKLNQIVKVIIILLRNGAFGGLNSVKNFYELIHSWNEELNFVRIRVDLVDSTLSECRLVLS